MTDRDAGLTLVEMLVVLAIMAVGAGATVLSLSPQRGGGAEIEARRLAAIVQAASDRAMASDASAELVIESSGYQIVPASRYGFPAGIAAVVPTTETFALTFDAAPPFDVVLARGDDRWRVRFDGLRATAVRAGPA